MKKPIFTALSPNTEWDDVWLAAGFCFRPWKWVRGGAVKELEQKFREYLEVPYAFSFSSGRGALYALLLALDLNPEDEVLLQSYTCVAVPNAVIWAGAKPVYVDIEESTFNMSPEDLEKKITPRSRVLIVQHTFGMPADMERLSEIAKAHDLFVIEDCAHALGAEYKPGSGSSAGAEGAKMDTAELSLPGKGRVVGTLGHAAFFSFGRDKVISSVFGGMAVTKSDFMAEKISGIYRSMPEAELFWAAKQLLQPIIAAKGRFFYNFFGLGKFILWVSRRLGLISLAVLRNEYRAGKPGFAGRKMPNALAELALRQFAKLERFNTHRREIAELYERELRGRAIPSFPPSKLSSVRPIHLRYTIFITRAAEILDKAKKNKIFLGDWYNVPVAPRGVDYGRIGYIPGSCPVAERLANQSVNLPTDIHITEKEARRVIEFLKNSSSEVRLKPYGNTGSK